MENNDGEPRMGNISEYMKKDLRRIKVMENRKELFLAK